VAQQVKSEMFRNFVRLFLSDRDPARTINATGENSFEVSNKAGEAVSVELDPATGLPAKLHFQSQSMQGEPAKMSVTLSDWADVDGIKMAKKALIEQNGQKFAETTVVEAKLNNGLTVEELSKKP
jgi:hypothetical protein